MSGNPRCSPDEAPIYQLNTTDCSPLIQAWIYSYLKLDYINNAIVHDKFGSNICSLNSKVGHNSMKLFWQLKDQPRMFESILKDC